MKLKDILKTDTDNKGWLKVFKKLGADAEMLKYVNENISKSGGGGEINEYYYKINEDNTFSVRMFYTLLLLFTTSKIDIIVPFINDADNEMLTGEVGLITYFLYENLNITAYFKISDIIQPIVSSVSERGNHDITTEYYTEGDLFTKVDYALNLIGSNSEMLEMANIVKDNVIAITKEEYESMITYKP